MVKIKHLPIEEAKFQRHLLIFHLLICIFSMQIELCRTLQGDTKVSDLGCATHGFTADSKNLGSRALCNSLFFEGHLTPASKPFESPTSANERPKRKMQRRVNLSCVSWWLCNQKVRSTTRATDKVFGISCKDACQLFNKVPCLLCRKLFS